MNFEYLNAFPDMQKLYKYCQDAEEFAQSRPNISATSARSALEYIVKMIYASLVGSCYSLTIFDMMSDSRFINYINDNTLLNTFHSIRKYGNAAVHEGRLSEDEALKVLKELHFLVGEYCILLGLIEDYPEYIKPGTQMAVSTPTGVAKQNIAESPQKVVVEPEIIAKFAPRMREARFNVKHKRDEEENKKLYMAACLREAEWPIVSQPNQAMPNSAGINMMLDDGDSVDYILYGNNNRPLAIIEYTTTKDNLIAGRTKAIEKANKLAQKYGYKPVVYYTNGYHIYVIDQLGFAPRRVFQYHTNAELELFILRATIRQNITAPVIDEHITNRDYQKEAIKSTCLAFSQYRRRSLLVMATGTGKTRVSISLVDILMKANWAKNVLFLADRTSLVRQAHKNFNKLLPSVTTSIYAGSAMQKDPNARIIFSTYQTMINLINDDTREFSIGRFDLIIIDEAHRSIFKKYGSLFHYFDAMMIGLTATPRAETNRNDYELFELKDGKPDYAYELEEAIQDGYLVGFSVLDRTTNAMRRGIHYDELSEEEKERFEDTFATGDLSETGSYDGTVIDPTALQDRYHINKGTIDAMLGDLMQNGLKINGGDKLGKTIIFASSHVEAEIIVQRFQHLYSYLGLDFCKLIDSQVEDSQNLIDRFGEREQLPQVAVSVDMLDTGIDVPDVLNLVFFKSVKSKIKFLQMIGRGTRLCPNVFGPGLDKKGFLIFDYYDNFNFFRTGNTWSALDASTNCRFHASTPQSVLINQRKLNILRQLTERSILTAFDVTYRDELKKFFIDMTQGLCNDEIEVQHNMAYVSKYRTAQQWDGFTDTKVEEIKTHILPLFPPETDPPKVKSFDHMIYIIEDEVQKRAENGQNIHSIRFGFTKVETRMNHMMEQLLQLKSIPEIVQKEPLIEKMRNAEFLFNNFSIENCEKVRAELRGLVRYLPDDVKYYVIDARDFIIDTSNGSGQVTKEKTYAEKAQEYLVSNDPILAKIRNLDELTKDEKDQIRSVFHSKLGTEAECIAWTGNTPLLQFIRVQVGIADDAIETKFGTFLNQAALTEQQLMYMNQIISYARENGDITFMDLQRVSPFCDTDIMSVFDSTSIPYIKNLISGLHNPVKE